MSARRRKARRGPKSSRQRREQRQRSDGVRLVRRDHARKYNVYDHDSAADYPSGWAVFAGGAADGLEAYVVLSPRILHQKPGGSFADDYVDSGEERLGECGWRCHVYRWDKRLELGGGGGPT